MRSSRSVPEAPAEEDPDTASEPFREHSLENVSYFLLVRPVLNLMAAGSVPRVSAVSEASDRQPTGPDSAEETMRGSFVWPFLTSKRKNFHEFFPWAPCATDIAILAPSSEVLHCASW